MSREGAGEGFFMSLINAIRGEGGGSGQHGSSDTSASHSVQADVRHDLGSRKGANAAWYANADQATAAALRATEIVTLVPKGGGGNSGTVSLAEARTAAARDAAKETGQIPCRVFMGVEDKNGPGVVERSGFRSAMPDSWLKEGVGVATLRASQDAAFDVGERTMGRAAEVYSDLYAKGGMSPQDITAAVGGYFGGSQAEAAEEGLQHIIDTASYGLGDCGAWAVGLGADE